MPITTKSVCVIGAGAAGLAAARHSLKAGLDVRIFEQTAQIGGTWVYSEEKGCHSSMYYEMKTNLPKEVMAYRDFPFDSSLPSFLDHRDVLEYLQKYSDGLSIDFNTTVESVTRIEEEEKWKIIVQNGLGTFDYYFDIVFVCNGHYFRPNNPYENSEFEGNLIHSHDYRHAEEFSNQKVIIIGAGPSGIDIGLQIAKTAKEIHLISKKAVYNSLPENIQQTSEHVEKVTKSGVKTVSGQEFEADSIIVCTGYHYQFPFFDSTVVRLLEDAHVVSPIFEHVVHVDYPKSLFFIGLNLEKAEIPAREELEGYEERQMSHQSSRGLAKRFYHLLQHDQWSYLDRISKLGQFESWKYMKTIEKITEYLQDRRKLDVKNYKMINFRFLDEEQLEYEIIEEENQ
ncbi:unnamed protein product [Caenorhabditis angaria]|uniref:Flavin-containing monooxygenase n=1 Tax=Caenorhabditis angaria TaxID=860376 RepID=A0A9P1MVB1_9PELO|nr:unnamed protein product [Caenorhabditis angaria]